MSKQLFLFCIAALAGTLLFGGGLAQAKTAGFFCKDVPILRMNVPELKRKTCYHRIVSHRPTLKKKCKRIFGKLICWPHWYSKRIEKRIPYPCLYRRTCKKILTIRVCGPSSTSAKRILTKCALIASGAALSVATTGVGITVATATFKSSFLLCMQTQHNNGFSVGATATNKRCPAPWKKL